LNLFIECFVAGVGAIVYVIGWYLSSINPAIPYILSIFSTLMIHNTAVTTVIHNYKSPTQKGKITARKNLIYLFIMLIVYWILTYIFINLGIIKK
jgi:hypothetical protein